MSNQQYSSQMIPTNSSLVGHQNSLSGLYMNPYDLHNSAAYSQRSISSSQVDGVYGGQQQMARSSSQDQLYSVLQTTRRPRPNAQYPQNAVVSTAPLGHYQHSPQHQYGKPSYTQSSQPHSPRKLLGMSTSTPSPSSAQSAPAGGAGVQYGSGTQQSLMHSVYQSSLPLRNMTTSTTSSINNSIYGQLRVNQAPLMQPSISYQNIHYQTELSGSGIDPKTMNDNHSLPYNRPMTSIGMLTSSALYPPQMPSQRPDLVQRGLVSSPTQQMSNLTLNNGSQPLANLQMQSHPNRQVLSSSSSTSLPSTPEQTVSHNQPQYGQYRATQQSHLHSPVKTPPPFNSGDTSNEIYSMINCNSSPKYGTAKTAQPDQQSISSGNHSQHENRVRTRYVCIGNNDSELSFQPNMIITNGKLSSPFLQPMNIHYSFFSSSISWARLAWRQLEWQNWLDSFELRRIFGLTKICAYHHVFSDCFCWICSLLTTLVPYCAKTIYSLDNLEH